MVSLLLIIWWFLVQLLLSAISLFFLIAGVKFWKYDKVIATLFFGLGLVGVAIVANSVHSVGFFY